MKNTIKLPQSQQDIIVKALQTYQIALKTNLAPYFNRKIRLEHQEYAEFDLYALTGMFKDKDVDVRIELDQEIHDSFAHRHGVDFPQYV
tara:strand:- start:626 stop:892 length:267 start_codon:yes stop_codon:yes gene_type:complete